MKRWTFGFAALIALACSDPAKEDPCPLGICTDDGGGGGDGGAQARGEAWTCSGWAKQQDGSYTRTCTDANACGTTNSRPALGPVQLPDLDKDFYECKVEPIFDRGCAMLGCHGTETGRPLKLYARGRLRHSEMVDGICLDTGKKIDLATGTGTVMCYGWLPHTDAEWQSNFDDARSFMVGLTDPNQSDLLMQPKVGGKAHAGVHLFQQSDPDYQTIAAWLGGAKLGSTCDTKGN